MQRVDFKVLRHPADDPLGRVAALRVPGGATISRKEIDDYTRYVGHYGARGLAWIKFGLTDEGTERSPFRRFVASSLLAAVMPLVRASRWPKSRLTPKVRRAGTASVSGRLLRPGPPAARRWGILLATGWSGTSR